MSRHTPGPWSVPHDRGAVIARGREGSPIVAFVEANRGGRDDWNYPPPDEARANARLIAGAPGLLDAAERLVALATAALQDFDVIQPEEFDDLARAVDNALPDEKEKP